MKVLANPHLVQLLEVIATPKSTSLYLVLEYVDGGSIMLHNKQKGTFVYRLTGVVMGEATARYLSAHPHSLSNSSYFASRVFREVISALSYMHSNHVAHR
jgi:serine/threonine protein kinase